MRIPPHYFLTPTISQLLASIDASREIINTITIPQEVEMNIRRRSLLKSSLFSARIEGNTLTLQDISTRSTKKKKKVEVFNILKAINLVYQKQSQNVKTKDILDLHKITMNGLSPGLGRFRGEVSAIFNQAGIAIYMPPLPRSIPGLIDRLLKFINTDKERFVPVRACITHYVFEKIHPFLDGNGRVGRLLLQLVLHNGGYGMKGMLPLEEYLDTHRGLYYRGLEASSNDVTDYLEFMLNAIAATAQEAKKMVIEKRQANVEDYLLPRRAEILNIIKDHRLVNFDQIRRRFISVNGRTLRYDLKKLADAQLIRKRGTTKGVYYESIDHS